MTVCVCGHTVLEHTAWNGAGIGCDTCSCSTYLPDDGTDPAPLSVRHETYVGRYRGPYRLGGSPTPEPVVQACGVCHTTWTGPQECPTCK